MRRWVTAGFRIGLALIFGFLWAFLIFLIPFIVTVLTDRSAGQTVFQVELFLVVTAVGCYSQTIVDNVAKALAGLIEASRSKAHGWHRSVLANLIIVGLSVGGVIIVGFWFSVRSGFELNLQGTVYNFNFFEETWWLAVVMMPILGIIQSWRHPFCKPSTAETV